MKWLGRILLVLFLILLVGISWVLLRTLNTPSQQLSFDAIELRAVSPNAKKHLSEALQFRTISNLQSEKIDSSQFELMKGWLKNTYPLVDSLLGKRIFNDYAHLYHWQGKNKDLAPAILMGHLDVVPVPKENLPSWKVAPFEGKIEEGHIWGRGAIDDKINVVGLMEAAEALLAEGFEPERSLYLAFGHDEEVGGKFGAQAIVQHLKEQGIKAEFVLDEGYTLTKGLIPGLDQRVALIGIAEKGYCSIRMSVEIEGGHSSIPAKETAIDVIANAIHKLHENPFPQRISYPVQAFIKKLGPEMPFVNRMAFGNYRLFEPMLLSIYEGSNTGNALTRTTLAPTIFHSGVKDNVIPQQANVTFNLRLLPGDNAESVLAHLKKHLNDPRIQFQVIQYFPPSQVSSEDSWAFERLEQSIKEVFPATLTSPNLVLGATDGRFYHEICDDVYRFAPYHLTPETTSMFHGLNERISVEDFENAVRFYARLMENVGK